jgi:LacI family transcriptional regulator
VNTIDADVALPSVTAHNYDGALMAMDHLLQLGHERIACLQGRMVYRCCQDRYRGYLDALRTAGIQPDPELTKPGDFVPEQIRSRARELFALPPDQRPTAVFAHSDVTAYAVMTAAADAGLRVPEDVSVIGFDDIESAGQIRPPLTTIQQPFVDMGKRAAEMLLAAIGPNDEEPDTGEADDDVESSTELPRLVMPTSLIVRASCGPVPVTRSPRGRTQTTKA